MKPMSVLATVVASAGLVAACASTFPPPNNEWAAAQGDVGRAQAGGAPSVPDARLHLQLAEEDLQKAKGLMGTDGDSNRRALSLTDLARAEAQLALGLAKQAEAEGQAHQAQAELTKASAK